MSVAGHRPISAVRHIAFDRQRNRAAAVRFGDDGSGSGELLQNRLSQFATETIRGNSMSSMSRRHLVIAATGIAAAAAAPSKVLAQTALPAPTEPFFTPPPCLSVQRIRAAYR